VKVPQLCPTLCDPMDHTTHGILQARILEWVAFRFSRGSSQPGNRTQISHIAGRFLTSPAQLLAFAPGKEQAAGMWEPWVVPDCCLSSALAFPSDLGARRPCRGLRGWGCAHCQSLPRGEQTSLLLSQYRGETIHLSAVSSMAAVRIFVLAFVSHQVEESLLNPYFSNTFFFLS